ncbi:MAG: hypothetical protein KAT61_06030, partial [Gammaproteobacteria bacterium]|nr:hypothetical protein [Gammaproteobacteria bacterium]
MKKHKHLLFSLLTSLSLLSVVLCYSPLISAADTSANGDAPINTNTANAILKELKEIRRVLEKIEKQGGR